MPPVETQHQENRQPRARACAFCRASKHRCDGQEDIGLECSRCARNFRKCFWPERKPMGRPKQNAKRIANALVADSPTAATSYRQSPTTKTNSPVVLANESSWQTPEGWLHTPSSGDTRPAFEQGFSGSSTDTPLSSRSHTTSLPLPQVNTSYGFDIPQSNSPYATDSALSTDTDMTDTTMKLLEVFYNIPHRYLPLLPPKAEFIAEYGSHSPLLLNSVFALAAPYASFPVFANYRTQAMMLLDQTPTGSLTSQSLASVQYIQAVLMLVYVEFGSANIRVARNLCQRACLLAQQLGWNMFDAASPRSDTMPISPSEVAIANLNTSIDLMRRVGNGQGTGETSPAAVLARKIRVTWWECWVTDIILSVNCRQQRYLHGVVIDIQHPSAPALYSTPGCPLVWHYPLRVKTLTLLLEAIGFPPCQDEGHRQQHAEQFSTFDTLTENVLMECHLAWSDCVKITNSYSEHLGTTALGQEAAIGKELYFMTILMLHASRSYHLIVPLSASIHLHHLYAMPEVNFDLQVCGLTTPTTLVDLQKSNASEEYSANVFTPSLSKIVSSSRSLMALMRSAQKSSVLSTTQQALPTPGIAGYTDSMSMTNPHLSGPRQASNDIALAVTEDILRHSPFCGCSQVVAAFGAALEVATATSKWQAMAAESNFETSKMVLQRLKRLWPVAGVFECEQGLIPLPHASILSSEILEADITYLTQPNLINAMVQSRGHYSYGNWGFRA